LICAARATRLRLMQKNNNSGGFSLAELLLSMLIGLMILLAVYQAFNVHSGDLKTQRLNVEMLQNARVGLDFTVRELRMAGYNPAGTLNDCTGTSTAANTPCAGLTSIANDSISFTADLNGNGNLTPDDANPDENITYNLYNSGGVMYLGRTTNGSLQPAAMNITSLSFNFYDGSNQTTTELALIRKIRVSVTAQAAAPGANNVYKTITLSSDVVPKCLGY